MTNEPKLSEKKPPLTKGQKTVLGELKKSGPSYAAKMGKKLKTYSTGITEIFKQLIGLYPGLLQSEVRKMPDNEIKTSKMAMYYWIADKKLAQELLDECDKIERLKDEAKAHLKTTK